VRSCYTDSLPVTAERHRYRSQLPHEPVLSSNTGHHGGTLVHDSTREFIMMVECAIALKFNFTSQVHRYTHNLNHAEGSSDFLVVDGDARRAGHAYYERTRCNRTSPSALHGMRRLRSAC
jgi:hypothetical protein